MTEQTLQSTKDTDNPDERIALRERAKIMGINHSPNISNAKLKERIQAVLNDQPDPGEPGFTGTSVSDEADDETTGVLDDVDVDQVAARLAANNARVSTPGKPLTKKQMIQAERERQWSEELKLVRVRVNCLNPQKAQLKGEIFTVSNKFLGTIRKYVPFGEGSEKGYHVPVVIYNEILNRQYQSVTIKKEGNNTLPSVRLVKEFAVEVLPPLTQAELAALARTQTIAENQ